MKKLFLKSLLLLLFFDNPWRAFNLRQKKLAFKGRPRDFLTKKGKGQCVFEQLKADTIFHLGGGILRNGELYLGRKK